MFYKRILWFFQDFKSENLFFKSILSSRNENTVPVTRDVEPSKMSNETPLQL